MRIRMRITGVLLGECEYEYEPEQETAGKIALFGLFNDLLPCFPTFLTFIELESESNSLFVLDSANDSPNFIRGSGAEESY